MNKQQRDYAIQRVKSIAKQKHYDCECEKPSLSKHIRRAITAGLAKLKSPKEITAKLERQIIEEDGYNRKLTLDMSELYEAPQSYKESMAELKGEQEKHDAENKSTDQFAQGLIDRIELGEFEDGKEPIRLMEAYSPTPPKTAARRI